MDKRKHNHDLKKKRLRMLCHTWISSLALRYEPYHWSRVYWNTSRLSTNIKYNLFFVIFQLQQGIAIIPKTVTASRLKENLNICDFSLTNEEMATIASIGTGQRVSRFLEYVPWMSFTLKINFLIFKITMLSFVLFAARKHTNIIHSTNRSFITYE